MTTTRPHTVLPVDDLVGHPGRSRPLSLRSDVPEGLVLPLTVVDGPVRLEGVLESLADGVLARGTVTVDVRLRCARCLRDVTDRVGADVAELYADPATADDPADVEPGYALRDGTIDVDALLRDALVDAVPTSPRCRPDCRGLCATCGADRNQEGCGCADASTDPRWAALAGLRPALPDHD